MLVHVLLFAISATASAVVLLPILRSAGVPSERNTFRRAASVAVATKGATALLQVLPWGTTALAGPCVVAVALVYVYELSPAKAAVVAIAHAVLIALFGCGLGV